MMHIQPSALTFSHTITHTLHKQTPQHGCSWPRGMHGTNGGSPTQHPCITSIAFC